MKRAFTLVELLVAIAVFVAVMLIGTIAVKDFSRAGREADQILSLHARHAALARLFDERLGNAAGFAGIWLRQGDDGSGDLVWMHTMHLPSASANVRNRDLRVLYLRTSGSSFDNYNRSFGRTDLVWGGVRWENDGRLYMGHSQFQHYDYDRADGQDSYERKTRFNHAIVTPQEEMSYLLGRGSATKLEPLYKEWDGRAADADTWKLGRYLDSDGDDERRDEYDDWFANIYSIGIFGEKYEENESFAVLNPDGRSVNKDWMFLAGSPDESDQRFDQRLPIERGIEFPDVRVYDRYGRELLTERDSLEDGADSLDWQGLPATGELRAIAWDASTISYVDRNIDSRPSVIQLRWLLHAVPMQRLDDGDLDDDGDFDEYLVDAIRQHVQGDASLTTQAQRREAFRAAVREQGYAAEVFVHVAEVSL